VRRAGNVIGVTGSCGAEEAAMAASYHRNVTRKARRAQRWRRDVSMRLASRTATPTSLAAAPR